ncbi:hypothetical protein PK35_00370 [Tamlana nanhaiensis]|uniref:Pectinesterase catalytic domain-containing protein n=1 Tax=Neotamlana nanhaiensis TaxID=1382798 RepID=A0A0D7W5D2_9FLAO|nr:hypothetical protein [Tamlana nanhaiensis]KJD34315.1 hypothetical protein PK35_00370 [Tamlana nanhaiensis]
MQLKNKSYWVLLIAFIVLNISMTAQNYPQGLSKEVVFWGDYINYKNKNIQLGPKAFFIDGSLSNNEVAQYDFVFNSINEASKHLTNGNEDSPMVLYIAPWVYWIDNPDDPEIRMPDTVGGSPIGLEINCEWLKFRGLSDNPEHVILACNRGQTMGSKGNFTMFRINGNGTNTENITFGNYCNIDLEYPLNPKLNREKRGSAIVQAQLIFSNGDKIVARNTHFISRLNLGPFWGSKRTLFDKCHFEMTDDALNGSAVYLNSTFEFYSSKPFGHTVGTGAVFLNCDIKAFTRNTQYFVKGRGPVAAIDTRFISEDLSYIGWRDIPDLESRYYQSNITLNENPLFISKNESYATVDISKKTLLDAYRITYNDKVIYNTYNLLKGNDDWDPMGIKSIVQQIETETGKIYSSIPTQLVVKSTQQKIETGKDSLLLETIVNRFGNFKMEGETIIWKVSDEFKSFVKLKDNEDGTCLIIPTNDVNETKKVIVSASTPYGLESATVLYIAPSFLNPPKFKKLPKISTPKKGKLSLYYDLDMSFEDQSIISWYRCKNVNGDEPIEIAVSRFDNPLKTYQLSNGDVGFYIMASVSPKHLRCNPGEAKSVVYKKSISEKDVKSNPKILEANFETMSGKYQPQVLQGFWTLDSYAPLDTKDFNWEADNSQDHWYYGEGINGAAGVKGFVQNTKGARMRYTPVDDSFGDMKISFLAVPSKTAGQGFSSARMQYMDVGIKMDTKNMNGYALRLIRTTKYSDAIDFVIMKYENGNATAISEAISATCYRPNCKITVEVKGNKLLVHAENTEDYFTPHNASEVVKVVNMETEIMPNTFGGVSFQHTGTVRSGATLIKDLKIEWF